MEENLTRKERRALRRKQVSGNTQDKLNFDMKYIEPLTYNQKVAFGSFSSDKNLMLHGLPGTGKSFISLYLSLSQIMTDRSPYNKLVIVRSTVPSREIGHLPGNQYQKVAVYESPYQEMFTELFNRSDAYEYLKKKNIVEFISTSFIRGITFRDCIVVVDEMQNMSFQELDTIITRIGDNCKIVFCGDWRQTDLTKVSERKGLHDFMTIIKQIEEFSFVEFGEDDIVRGKLVKSYIIAKNRLGLYC